MRWNTNTSWTETHCTTWQCLQSWYWSSLRTNLVNLLGWGRGRACVAMETLTDGALVLIESWAGLWNNISCFISLPLSSSCPFLSFHLSSVSLFVLFTWKTKYRDFLIWLQHFMAPLLSSAVFIISTISLSARIRVSLVYLLLWSIIRVLVRLKCPRDKPVYSSG